MSTLEVHDTTDWPSQRAAIEQRLEAATPLGFIPLWLQRWMFAAKQDLRSLLTRLDQVEAENERIAKDRDELSGEIESCHKMLDIATDEYDEATTSVDPLDTRLRQYLFPEGRITDDMVNGDD